jgi:type IV pilus assembly protein PilE
MKHNHLSKLLGFSLLELMMALAIFSIIAGISLGTYQQYLHKSRRTDGQTSLISLQLAQEQYRANCLQYATTLASNSNCNSDSHYTLSASAISPNHYYQLSIQSANATSYMLTATATGIQLGDSNCQVLSIDQAGNKSARSNTGQIATDCW